MEHFTGKTYHKSKNSVKSLQEFFIQIEYAKKKIFKTGKIWYRGLANANYKLVPNIYRIRPGKNEEVQMRNDFKDKAKGFIKWSGLDDYEWYFLMQHYGLKTRLLDWTEGYLIALFFALKLGSKDNRFEDPCVWLINPYKLNFLTQGTNKLVRTEKNKTNGDYDLAEEYLNLDFKSQGNEPIAISASYSNDRILRQKGCFTLHGDSERDILSIYRKHKSNELCSIIINRKHVEQITEELSSTGISESSIFPDLEGLSREINNNSY